jgi:hypothetical protein
MAKKNADSLYEIRVMMAPKDIQRLNRGEVVQLGSLSFGLPIKICLEKNRSQS